MDELNRAVAAGSVFFILLLAFGFILVVAYWFCWVFAIVRCLTRCPKEDRISWLLVVLFVPLFGWLLYFLIGPKVGRLSSNQDPPYIPPTAKVPPNIDETARAVAREIQSNRKRLP
jgi:hypothetical protein